jgi:hypothetical protein
MGPSGPDSRPQPSHARLQRHRWNLKSRRRLPWQLVPCSRRCRHQRLQRAHYRSLGNPSSPPELRRPISPTPSILSVGYDDVPLGFPRGPPPCQRRSLRPPSFRGGECTTVSASSRSILDVAAEDRFPPIRPPQRHRSRNLTRVASDTARTRRHREQDETDNVFPTPKGRTHRRYRVRHSGTSVRPVDSRCHARVATNATRPAYSPQDADKAQRHAPKV